ncbi:TPA: methyltransferase domain-containing protein [Streptococcus suis]|uniref:rRNA (Guanine-N1)-methyltransferase n=1 Tax=Streptococcus suis 6407 TaxID=1214179 RepID=A0A075SSE6_STRSU|nr:methyltransferase domain-containing protein [Streptococcus suis]AIG43925.1 rRNA (guanine-N1)-methyltransferase [Streptococcus suis 6407]UUM54946.1 methyltransferase domain-containing protein [Streptococcus suis]HEL1720317.1 methyltransferase domain-containing protein [Streptococcus suis]HEL1805786.1 methyltransferase domain-containing protein [Streptococcus suis]HEL1816601.1 methyltransferase domain-containing protein [Streptococcus suis]
MTKHPRFSNSDQFFACPHCGQALGLELNSLRCPNRHTFDIAKQGYVNLAPQVKQSANYHKSSFENRQAFLEAGYYDHLYEALERKIAELGLRSVLDIGCGEGFYSRKLAEKMDLDILAFDISKDSILLAAKSDRTKSVKWFVSDLTKLPIQDKTIDGILDIFSPANYQEFARVLKAGGAILKLVPGPNHLKELRHLAKDQLRKESYDNQDIVDHFKSYLGQVEQVLVSRTLPITAAHAQVLADMTPLFFQVDQSKLDLSQLTEITIEGVLLIGTI